MRRSYFYFDVPSTSAQHNSVDQETSGGTVTRTVVSFPTPDQAPVYYTLTVPTGIPGLACVSFGGGWAVPLLETADVAVRVKITAGNNHATGRISFALGRGIEVQPDPTTHGAPFTVSNGGFGSLTDQMLMVSLLGDGNLELGAVIDGSYAAIAATTVGPVLSAYRTSDPGVWIRVVRTPTTCAVWWGVADGAGLNALPTRWTCALVSNDVDALTASSFMRTLRVSVQTSAGITGGFAAQVLDAAWLGPWVGGLNIHRSPERDPSGEFATDDSPTRPV